MGAATRPDLFVYMDAYKVLGVEYSADPSEIRRAHKRLARQHHPDRFPAGSAEQQQATLRMAQINDAYALVREAPLRHHRVSRASEPDVAWTDDELDRAVDQARVNRKIDLAISVALAFVAIILVPAFLSLLPRAVHSNPLGLYFVLTLTMGAYWLMWLSMGPQMWRVVYKVQLAVTIVRLLGVRW